MTGHHSYGQNKAIRSSIVNFGSNTCGDKNAVTFSSIGDPTGTPYLISSCSVNPPFSDVFSKFIAYNPKDNKIYINDISGNDSKIYIYDMGLPYSYTCPSLMPSLPNYNYSYVPNNFEFDINGDVWSVRNLYDSSAIIEKIDEATGTVLFSKTLSFPSANIPNTLSSGDITILPNGRMFIVMGDTPGKFFEISNYTSSIGNATASFIQNMPNPCYGIMYINGNIELTGTDFGSSCYRYIYDISAKTMSAVQPFQLGLTPVDNSSISPATGVAKKLIGNAKVDSVTQDLVYEIYAKNLGNVKLNNFNILEDLGAVFGSGNISAVNVSLLSGGNPGNLLLNPAFDGTSNTKIFLDGQLLSNLANGYAAVRVAFRTTNLINNKIYYNTAKATGDLGTGLTKITVIDSSNNGDKLAIDPNLDGDAGDMSENIPTPYYFGMILPIKFIGIDAARINKNQHSITWSIASLTSSVYKFVVEFSEDGKSWQAAGSVAGDPLKINYSLNYTIYSSSTIHYRVRAYEESGKDFLSKEVIVKNIEEEATVKITPNPADKYIGVYSEEGNFSNDRKIYVIDMNGKKVYEQAFVKKYTEINTSTYTSGYYVVNIVDKGEIVSSQVLIKHK